MENQRNVVITPIIDDHFHIYHLGIIDYLQDYNFSKRVEHFSKTWLRGEKMKQAVSVAPAAFYQARFKDFMINEVINSVPKDYSRKTFIDDLKKQL